MCLVSLSLFSTHDVIGQNTDLDPREGRGHLSVGENWADRMNQLQNMPNACERFASFRHLLLLRAGSKISYSPFQAQCRMKIQDPFVQVAGNKC